MGLFKTTPLEKNAVAEAIHELTDELREIRRQKARHFEAATKADLNAAKAEILKAISERNDEIAAVKQLVTASGKLERAVAANTPKPISGS